MGGKTREPGSDHGQRPRQRKVRYLPTGLHASRAECRPASERLPDCRLADHSHIRTAAPHRSSFICGAGNRLAGEACCKPRARLRWQMLIRLEIHIPTFTTSDPDSDSLHCTCTFHSMWLAKLCTPHTHTHTTAKHVGRHARAARWNAALDSGRIDAGAARQHRLAYTGKASPPILLP